MGIWSGYVRCKSAAVHHVANRAVVLGRHIEKSTHPLGLEDEAAAVLIRLYQVIEAGVGEEFFQAQRLVEFLGDVDQREFVVVAEIVGLAAHVTAQPPRRASKD